MAKKPGRFGRGIQQQPEGLPRGVHSARLGDKCECGRCGPAKRKAAQA